MGHGLDRSRADDPFAAIAVFAATVAVGVAAIGYACRLGFADNSLAEWANYVGLSWFLIHFSSLVRRVAGLDPSLPLRPSPPSGRWWTSHASLTVAGLVAVALLGNMMRQSGTTVSAIEHAMRSALVIVGTSGTVLAVLTVSRARRLPGLAVLLMLGACFSLYGAGAAWGNGYQHPLFVEDMCFGWAQIDTLVHASITNMLRTYGVSSTGLDGLPFVPYHFGSHWLFGRLCNLLDVRAIDFYNRGYAVIFIPFGVFSLATFGVSMAQRRRGKNPPETSAAAPEGAVSGSPTAQTGQIVSAGPLFWLVLLAGWIGVLPYVSGVASVVTENSIIISESYALAVAVSLLAIASAVSFFDEVSISQSASLVDRVLGVIGLALLVGAVGFLKNSVILVLAVSGAFVFIRLRLYRSATMGALAVLGALCAGWSFLATYSPYYSEQSGLVPFAFLRTNVDPQWWAYFWLVYYAWFWILAALRIRSEGVRTLRQLAEAVRQRRLIDVEFVLVAALVGAAPGILMSGFSSLHYFSDYQRWLALGLILSFVASHFATSGRPAFEGTPATVAGGSANPPRRLLDRLTVGRVFGGVVVVCIGATLAAKTLLLLSNVSGTDLASRGHPSGQTGFGLALAHGRFDEARAILGNTAAAVESRMKSDKSILTVLGNLDRMPLAEKRNTLLFIPHSNRAFWDLLHGPYKPLDGPLAAPALSGLAMIDGLRPIKRDGLPLGYGYGFYPQLSEERHQPPLKEYLPTLRERCARMGFNQLIVIESAPNGESVATKYECP